MNLIKLVEFIFIPTARKYFVILEALQGRNLFGEYEVGTALTVTPLLRSVSPSWLHKLTAFCVFGG
jgi:hypothetical protein